MLEQRIQQQFFDCADLQYAAAEVLSRPIADAVDALVGCITAAGKVLVCGNGVSAADAQHFAAQFVGRFERERPGLAAIALTSNPAALTPTGTGDDDFSLIFSKPVQALGAPGDLLLVISTDGLSTNVLAAVDAAHAKEMTVVALAGRGGGPLRGRLNDTDVLICVPHERAARIQEVHRLVLNCLCDAVDQQLLGEPETTA